MTIGGALTFTLTLTLASNADDVVKHAQQKIDEGTIAGAVVVAGTSKGATLVRALGKISAATNAPPMPEDGVFDLASVTKVVVGGSMLAVALQEGALELDDAAADHVPELRARHGDVVIDQLLRHVSGLPPIVDVRRLPAGKPDSIMRAVGNVKARFRPGEQELYSDVGVLVLGRAVERSMRRPLDALLITRVLSPLGMRDTGFVVDKANAGRRVPSTTRPPPWGLRAHDPIARAYQTRLVFPAHAGLFSTGPDLGRYCAALLRGGDGVFDEDEVELMLRPAGGANAYGWSAYAGADGTVGVGKVGFTGTFVFVAKSRDLFLVYLTNRTAVKDDEDVQAPDFEGAVTALLR